MTPQASKRMPIRLLVAVNTALLVVILLMFAFYNSSYQSQLRRQNLNDISNLNRSAATLASDFLSNRQQMLLDIVQYVNRHHMQLDESMEFIYDSNSNLENSLQLVGTSYKGYLVDRDQNGAFSTVDYSSNVDDLKKILLSATPSANGTVGFTPEFTDYITGRKCFALYVYVNLFDIDCQYVTYTLMSVMPTNDFNEMINVDGGFEDMSSVLCDLRGNYIMSNGSFKSRSFFQYLYVYNNLTLDQMNAIKAEVEANGSGFLYYRNYRNEDCAFGYCTMNDMLTVSCIPLSSFHRNDFDIRFTVMAIVILLCLLVFDITWFNRLNHELRISAEHEREANNAKTDFLSRMSHDIRTPLNGILGMTVLALDEPNPLATQECLRNIDSSGKFLLGLVNDVLDMSKVESGKMTLHPEPYSFAEFDRHICSLIRPLAASHNVEFSLEQEGCANTTLMLDHLRFNQVYFNLLSNAIKFTPKGGHVRLWMKLWTNDKGQAILDTEVSDNGIGMSKEFQEHMFEAFSQENRAPNQIGTGLGLSIVYSLVKLMKGQIDVHSKEGEGTTFHVQLQTTPVTDESAQKLSAAGFDEAILNGKRVLLCEDHPMNATIATRLLQKKGMTVDHAENGQIGVELFAASAQNAYDAVLMDVRMPVMGGLDATRAIRALERDDAHTVPIIAMTANAYDIDIQNSLNAGMNEHLAKPIEPEKLYQTLCKFLQPK